MEPVRKKRFSPVWEHFELICLNKVKCLLCFKVIGYNDNTSSMLRHYRALHEGKETSDNEPSSGEKSIVDEALVDMVIEDLQPFTIVEDKGFQKLIKALNPNYVLPTKQTLKSMVEYRFQKSQEKAKAAVCQAAAVSLTADMWTPKNTDSYLAVTGHFIDASTSLQSVVLGVLHVPLPHTTESLASAQAALMSQWDITHKVTGLVTDGATNMAACANAMNLEHSHCVADCFNIIVQRALEENPVLCDIRAQARKIVAYFKSSTTAKETLVKVNKQMGRPKLKLTQEVDTRWNSTYQMLQDIYNLRKPVGAALAGLTTDTAPLSSQQYVIIAECLKVLSPFHDATVELCEEKWVSGSKVIPLLTMLHHVLEEEDIEILQTPQSRDLVVSLRKQVKDKLFIFQSKSLTSLATLLDPRFKKIGFYSPHKAEEAEKRLIAECAAVSPPSSSSSSSSSLSSSSSSSEASLPGTQGSKLWQRLDATVQQTRIHNETAAAALEVQTYLAEPNINRSEDPLQYWETYRNVHHNLYKLAVKILCTPASSVPCERVFSKAGERISKKRSCLKPSTVEKLLFLNENE